MPLSVTPLEAVQGEGGVALQVEFDSQRQVTAVNRGQNKFKVKKMQVETAN